MPCKRRKVPNDAVKAFTRAVLEEFIQPAPGIDLEAYAKDMDVMVEETLRMCGWWFPKVTEATAGS